MKDVLISVTLILLSCLEFAICNQAEIDSDNNCERSLTTINGGKRVCRRQILLDERFKTLNESLWSNEIFIPSYYSAINSDMVFNYFDKDNSHVKDSGGVVICPTVLDDDFVRRGTLKLEGCTGKTDDECEKTAKFQWILPPVVSARITTKNSFSFKYGKITINAKFPKGDWIVPELWLEPKNSVYGEGLESGRIIIAMARGNIELRTQNNAIDLGASILESSLMMSSGGRVRARTARTKGGDPWQSHYSQYSFIWGPDGYKAEVNGVEVGSLVGSEFQETLAHLMNFSREEEKIWYKGSAFAPFDQEFYVSLGLSVGGRVFPDNVISKNYKKPWKNRTVKEMLDFWRAKDKWEPTWKDEVRRCLHVLKVKVQAL